MGDARRRGASEDGRSAVILAPAPSAGAHAGLPWARVIISGEVVISGAVVAVWSPGRVGGVRACLVEAASPAWPRCAGGDFERCRFSHPGEGYRTDRQLGKRLVGAGDSVTSPYCREQHSWLI